jgi:DNA-binding beta-propeller fold protein YncE
MTITPHTCTRRSRARLSPLLVTAAAATALFTVLAAFAFAADRPAKTVIRTPGTPAGLASGLGAVWVGAHRAGFVYRIDPHTNKAAAITVPDVSCVPPVITATAVWTGGCNAVYKIDPSTNRVVGSVPGLGPVYGAGSLWTFSMTTCRLFRIDPRSGLVLVRIRTGVNPGAAPTDGCAPIAVAFGSVWVNGDTEVARIDIRTNKLTRIIPLAGGKQGSSYPGGYLFGGLGAVASGKLWLTNAAGVYEIDPAANTATQLPIRIKPFSEFDEPQITAGAGSIWFRTSDHTIARVNAATGKLIATYPGDGGGGLTYAYHALWLSEPEHDTTWREQLP